jgi:acyl-CoA synthetase (NDP forming)
MNRLIRSALEKGDPALSEYNSKQMLKAYGIPVTREALVQSPGEAAAAAQALGYPVVIKACSPRLMHKSEAGAVAVGIADEAALLQAYDRIQAAVDQPLEGMLIQEMVKGSRELVVGLTRDAQFGPCVMLGLGGVLTEVLKDTAFRVAPFDANEALDMMTELRSQKVLDHFRGQAPADRNLLADTLVAVGRLALENEAIAEIDINPLIIDPQGRLIAVDALIVLRG